MSPPCLVAAALLVLAMPAIAPAACRTGSGADRPHLVELYTSEGCSSCPPAETWLSALRGKPAWLALEYHVDYWDTPAFRDPWADARHTARQRAFARAQHVNVVTPQIVLDGRPWKNWPRGAPPAPVDTPAPALVLEAVRDGLRVTAQVTTAAGSSVYLAVTEDGLSHAIGAGENRGKRLHHDQVVRAFDGPHASGTFAATLTLPADLVPARARLVAFVQDARDGRVTQAVALALAACTR